MTNIGAVLGDVEIRALCKNDPPLISDFLNFESQLQSTGFDITVKRITRLHGTAALGEGKHSRVAAEQAVEPAEGKYLLTPGAYLVYINEYTAIPNDIMGLVFARSTLFRSGGMLETGIWDGGFRGRGMLGLYVMGVETLYVDVQAPIAQITFFRTGQVERGFQFNEYWRET